MNPETDTVIQASKQCLTRLLPYITEPATIDFVASYVVTGEMPGHAWELPIRVSLVDPHSLARQLLLILTTIEYCRMGEHPPSVQERALRAEAKANHTCYEIRTWLTDNT